ncbi:MAG: hypothetical protein ACTTJJ_02020 [Prevotella fusca]
MMKGKDGRVTAILMPDGIAVIRFLTDCHSPTMSFAGMMLAF